MTHQGAACDAAGVHFGLTIRRTDILVQHGAIISTDKVETKAPTHIRSRDKYASHASFKVLHFFFKIKASKMALVFGVMAAYLL